MLSDFRRNVIKCFVEFIEQNKKNTAKHYHAVKLHKYNLPLLLLSIHYQRKSILIKSALHWQWGKMRSYTGRYSLLLNYNVFFSGEFSSPICDLLPGILPQEGHIAYFQVKFLIFIFLFNII